MRKPSGIMEDTSVADDAKELNAAREAFNKAKERLDEALKKNPVQSAEDPQEG